MPSMDSFDPERLRLPGVMPQVCPQAVPRFNKPPRHKPGERFLKGPVPWRWLERAARLPGQALAVGLAAWHLLGLHKNKTVRLAPSLTRSLGLSPRVTRRGLKALESASLVTVDRHRGRSPDVTLLDA